MAHHRRRLDSQPSSEFLGELDGILGHAQQPTGSSDDLTIFANTQFFDLDLGQQTDFRARDMPRRRRTRNVSSSAAEDLASTFSEYLSGQSSSPLFSFSPCHSGLPRSYKKFAMARSWDFGATEWAQKRAGRDGAAQMGNDESRDLDGAIWRSALVPYPSSPHPMADAPQT